MLIYRIKRILAALFIIIFLFTGALPVLANPVSYQANPDVPRNLHTTVQVVLIEVSNALFCQMTGIDLINPQKSCLTVDRLTSKFSYADTAAKNNPKESRIGGALGLVISMIGLTYEVPVHTQDFTSYLAANFGVVKSTYAQDTGGFRNLSPMLNLWSKVRDLSYVIFVVIFVLIGFSIMLRLKLDPKTVMNIQNQIPRIIISILLITFSYALAGLLIDFMWVSTYTGINLLSGDTLCKYGGEPISKAATTNLMNNPLHYLDLDGGLLDCVFPDVPLYTPISSLARMISGVIAELVYKTARITIGLGDLPESCGLTMLLFNAQQCGLIIVGKLAETFIGVPAMTAIVIAIWVQLFKLWFALLRAYIYLILYTLLGPIWILLGLIPNVGKSYGFASWVRHMLSGLMIYPITIFLFLVATILANDNRIINTNPDLSETFIPPLIANPAIAENMGSVLALAAILVAPSVVDMMRELFNAPSSKYTQTIFAGAGAGAALMSKGMAVPAAPVKAAWGYAMKRDSAGQAAGPLSHLIDKNLGGIAKKVVGNWQLGQTLFDATPMARTVRSFADDKKKAAEKTNNGGNGNDGGTPASSATPNPTGPQSGGGSSNATVPTPQQYTEAWNQVARENQEAAGELKEAAEDLKHTTDKKDEDNNQGNA